LERNHKGPAARAALDTHKFVTLAYLPRSPDLNPIENLFKKLIRRLEVIYVDPAKESVDLEEFEADVKQVLLGLEEDGGIAELARSMPRRCADVVKADGGPTKY